MFTEIEIGIKYPGNIAYLNDTQNDLSNKDVLALENKLSKVEAANGSYRKN